MITKARATLLLVKMTTLLTSPLDSMLAWCPLLATMLVSCLLSLVSTTQALTLLKSSPLRKTQALLSGIWETAKLTLLGNSTLEKTKAAQPVTMSIIAHLASISWPRSNSSFHMPTSTPPPGQLESNFTLFDLMYLMFKSFFSLMSLKLHKLTFFNNLFLKLHSYNFTPIYVPFVCLYLKLLMTILTTLPL